MQLIIVPFCFVMLQCMGSILGHGIMAKDPFPYQSFFNITDELTSQFMASHYLCHWPTHNEKCCSCDPKSCWRNRKCCIDIDWTKYEDISLDEYVDKFIQKALSHTRKECAAINDKVLQADYVEMLTSCANAKMDGNDYEVEMCHKSTSEDGSLLLPVGALRGNDLYKNKYCASCNGIEEYQKLKVFAICNTSREGLFGEKKVDPSRCVIHKANSEIMYSSCENIFERNVCPLSDISYNLCNLYGATVVERVNPFDLMYNNPHCMRCHDKDKKIDINMDCRASIGNNEQPIEQTFAYSYVVDFQQGYGCTKGLVWDDNLEKCTSFRCQKGYIKNGNKCLRDGEDIGHAEGNSFLSCFLSTKATLIAKTDNQTSLKDERDWAGRKLGELLSLNNNSFKVLLQNEFYQYKMPVTDVTTILKDLSSSAATDRASKRPNPTEDLDPTEEIYLSSVQEQSTSWMYGFDIVRNFPSYKVCHSPIIVDAIDVKFHNNCTATINHNQYSIKDYVLLIRIKQKQQIQQVLICNKYHLNSDCPQRTISMIDKKPPKSSIIDSNSADHSTVHNTNVEDIIIDGSTYTPERYAPTVTGVSVCIATDTASPLWIPQAKKGEYYLTVTGVLLSFPSYIMTIVVYGSLRELKSLPSFILIAICISLCLSDATMALLLSGVVNRQSYKIIAICIHWLQLNTQSWVCIIAYEYFKAFSNIVRLHRHTALKRFYIYLAICIAVPSIVITSTCLIDYYYPDYIGYGSSMDHFMDNFTAQMATHIVPLTVALFLSFIVLVAAVYKVCHHRDITGGMLQSGYAQISVPTMAIKIMGILGMVEVVGLIQLKQPQSEESYIFNTVFQFMYSFFRGFRGVLIFSLYVVNRRVFRIIKSKFETKLTNRSTLQTNCSNKDNQVSSSDNAQ